MILYRLTARTDDDFLISWHPTLNAARHEAKELIPLSVDDVYIDKLDLPGRDNVAFAMNHASANPTVMPGERVKTYTGMLDPHKSDRQKQSQSDSIPELDAFFQ